MLKYGPSPSYCLGGGGEGLGGVPSELERGASSPEDDALLQVTTSPARMPPFLSKGGLTRSNHTGVYSTPARAMPPPPRIARRLNPSLVSDSRAITAPHSPPFQRRLDPLLVRESRATSAPPTPLSKEASTHC